MIKQKIERIKTYILILLLFISVIQVGIHWNQQAQGFPFRLAQIFQGNQKDYVDVNIIKGAYFEPENITVSISPVNQWNLPKSNKYYKSVWTDIKQSYIPFVMSKKPVKVLPKENWNALLTETCTIIDFPVLYPNDLILWFEGLNTNESQSFTGIKSIAILPHKDVNETVNTVYVYDNNMVYMYNVNIKENSLPKAFYRLLPEELNKQTQIQPVTAIGELFPNLSNNPDILIIIDKYSSRKMQTIKIDIPKALKIDVESKSVDTILENILLNQKDSLMAILDDKSASAVFSDTENVYRLSSNGVLEYKYLPASEDPGNIEAAFINAISFIELRKKLLNSVEIKLSSIEKHSNSYTFNFDYIIDGSKVLVRDIKDNRITMASPITITASATRVLQCNWVMREFMPNKDHKNYINSFVDLVENKLFTNNQPLLKNGEVFEYIEEGYAFDVGINSPITLQPSWIVKTNFDEYVIPLSEEAE